MGYWHQRADERHGNPPQGNQELLVVKDKVGRPPGDLGVSKSMECDIFPSVIWHCWLVDRKGIRPVKKLGVGLLVMMIWLELGTIYSSSCHHHFHHPLLQWTPANPDSPGKCPLKRRQRIILVLESRSFQHGNIQWASNSNKVMFTFFDDLKGKDSFHRWRQNSAFWDKIRITVLKKLTSNGRVQLWTDCCWRLTQRFPQSIEV